MKVFVSTNVFHNYLLVDESNENIDFHKRKGIEHFNFTLCFKLSQELIHFHVPFVISK